LERRLRLKVKSEDEPGIELHKKITIPIEGLCYIEI
jgi:hypothetical protein